MIYVIEIDITLLFEIVISTAGQNLYDFKDIKHE